MITESMMTITCRCGYEDDFMAFRSAPVTGELPLGRYQCPKCRRAWTATTGPPRVGWSGTQSCDMTARPTSPPRSDSPPGSHCHQRLVRHLDLFSGIGGFALAAKMVGGIETIGFCEIDPAARQVLAANFPGVPIHDDVRTLNPQDHGPVDLITGGYPCQPFSYAGQRRGAEDDRHLWPAMRGVIEAKRPRWVLAENVAGHVTMGLDEVLTDLESIGYSAGATVIPACAVGANHRRDRVWIIAHAPGDRQQGELREALPQEVYDWTPETLGSRHWSGGAFADWEKLMGESQLRRMDDGVSSTLDVRPRLHAFGNAIVPQVAAQILRCMMVCDNMTNDPAMARRAGESNQTDG